MNGAATGPAGPAVKTGLRPATADSSGSDGERPGRTTRPRGSSARLSSVPTRSCSAGGPTRASPAPGRSRPANAFNNRRFALTACLRAAPLASIPGVSAHRLRASHKRNLLRDRVEVGRCGCVPGVPQDPSGAISRAGSLIRTRVNRGPPAVERPRTCPPRYRQRNRESSPRTVLSPSRPPGQECSGRGRRTSADGHLLQITRRCTQV